VRFGTAELLADADRPGGWLLSVDDIPQSYVDLNDPTHLDFEYVRRMADVLDALEPGPVQAVHIGGGACTLPRYLAATRPGSRQLVIEADGPLVELVREELGLRSVPRLRVRVGDGRAELATVKDGSAGLLVLDAFVAATMPGRLATVEAVDQIRRVLREPGVFLINIAADSALVTLRRILATVAARFPELAVLAEPAVLRGRRPGNLVLAASSQPLPIDTLARQTARAAFPVTLVSGPELVRFIGTAKPITDAELGQDAEVTR
jgi:spermidine synthase